jgi:acyl-CoA thioesterase I
MLMQKKFRLALTPILVAMGLAGLLSSCDSGGGDGGNSVPDVGDNDINKVLCVGDSITDGGCAPAGAPYPSRLGSLSGKSVINEGICGSFTSDGAARIGSWLNRHKPGYVCILYGINDVDFGRSDDDIIANLRFMVQSAKNNQSAVLLATLMPTYDSHAFSRDDVARVNDKIRSLAKSEGARLVDLEREFGSDRSLIQEDGLHPSDSGTQLIALSFNDGL